MATGLKISELGLISTLSSDDLFTVVDISSTTNARYTYGSMISQLSSDLPFGNLFYSGTPVVNQFAKFSAVNTLEGVPEIEFDGSTLTITGDTEITGNLNVIGTSVSLDAEISTTDSVVVLNSGEAGAGVTLGYSGFSVDRGTENEYFFGFDEVRDAFVLGEVTALSTAQIATTQVVATREDSPTNGYIGVYNTSAGRIDFVDPSTITQILSLGADTLIPFMDGVSDHGYSANLAWTGTSLNATQFNGVALTTGGASTAYLDATGAYSVPLTSGDVLKAGTPATNELGVWDSDGVLRGESNVLVDSSTLTVGGSSDPRTAIASNQVQVRESTTQLLVIQSDSPNVVDSVDGATLRGVTGLATREALELVANLDSADSGAIAAMRTVSHNSGALISTRPTLAGYNYTTKQWEVAANNDWTYEGNATYNGTGALKIPAGTTGERPTGVNGNVRYNSTTTKMEAYESGAWKNMITSPTGASIAAGQVGYGNSSGDLDSSDTFRFDDTVAKVVIEDLSSSTLSLNIVDDLIGKIHTSASHTSNLRIGIGSSASGGFQHGFDFVGSTGGTGEIIVSGGNGPIKDLFSFGESGSDINTSFVDLSMDDNDIQDVASLNRTGSMTINATTGVDLQYNGVTELSTESGMVTVANDLNVDGNVILNNKTSAALTIASGTSTSSGANLQLNGSTESSANRIRFRQNSSVVFAISSSGSVTINDLSGTGTEDVQASASGGLVRITSDEITKNIVGELNVGLDYVLKASENTIEYRYKNEDLNSKSYNYWGFGARGVTKDYGKNPAFRLRESENIYGWDSKQMIAPLYNAISEVHKDYNEKIKSLESKIEFLMNEIELSNKKTK